MSGVVTAVAAVVATGYTIYNGERSASAQENAQNQAKEAALKQEQQADQAMNKANQKKPDTASALSAAPAVGQGGCIGHHADRPDGGRP